MPTNPNKLSQFWQEFRRRKVLPFLIGYIAYVTLFSLLSCQPESGKQIFFDKALENGELANEGLRRCNAYVHAWLDYADAATGLIPENLNEGIDRWTPKNSAADNYPFMVLVSALTDSGLFRGKMAHILEAEMALTSRVGQLPDSYSFSKKGFVNEEVDMEAIIFGASEYVKDGLLPLTEYLGPSPWSERMIAITDDVWAHALVQTEFGAIPSDNVEVNGEQLQVLSRLYWMTGEHKYLDWAIRLGDYYLLGENHPTRDFESLRLNDHGCEIVSGLCELYASVHFAMPAKKEEYREAVHEMLDRILEIGRNEHGLFYVSVNPKTGEILEESVRDNWGYNFNGYYTVYLLDGEEKYRDALLLAFSHLENYRNYNWESGSADGFADAIEGGLNLYMREPLTDVAEWLDSETRVMWSLQDSSYRTNALKWQNQGIIEGWHGDGNFARTTIMYCLWKSQGTTLHPWREDLLAGAVSDEQALYISLRAEREWEGSLAFDIQRSVQNMKLPMDWPRINQFPEWFTLTPGKEYRVIQSNTGGSSIYKAEDLERGLNIKLSPGKLLQIEVIEL